MAECGIKRFDELPAAVRGIDVDALRALLKSPNLARFFLRYTFRTKEWIETDIKKRLNEACLLNWEVKQNIRKRWKGKTRTENVLG